MLRARKLLRRPVRNEEGAFLVEGPRAITEALRSDADVVELYLADGADFRELEELAERSGAAVLRASDRVVRALSDTTSPQGAVAVVAAPPGDLESLPDELDLVLVLAEVRDPGNAGTLVRSAAAAGAAAAVFTRSSVDALHPRTVRASAGTMFRLSVVRDAELGEAAAELRRRGVTLLGADARAPRSLYEVDLARPLAIVLGNEASGLASGSELLDDVVSIPMPGGAESLNVAVAGSIILFEAARRRSAR